MIHYIKIQNSMKKNKIRHSNGEANSLQRTYCPNRLLNGLIMMYYTD
ncbi:hypothetical protein BSM4216_1256 [Bacillus smithii]|nr:hypothetical protein BSM4216_1256 [Bacillus smithii]